MPALPSVPNVIRVALKGILSEDIDVINLSHYLYTGTAPSDAELLTLAGVFIANWIAHLGTHTTSDYVQESVTIEDLTSPTSAVATDTSAHAGTNSGSMAPAGCALVVSKHIARRYRGGHPRVYLAGMPVNELLDAQAWNSGWPATIATDWQDFEAVPGLNPWSGATSIVPVNVSYYSGFINHTYPSGRVRPVPVLRPAPVVDVIQSYSGNPKVCSQRRRNLQNA